MRSLTKKWKSISQFEYWNWLSFYLPLLPIWLFYAIRNRSFTYFSIANPTLPLGGFFKEDKQANLSFVPDRYKPETILISQTLSYAPMAFPFVAKPVSGQRGRDVRIITCNEEWNNYQKNSTEPFVIQTFIEGGEEYAVLWSKIPGEAKGKISSVCKKEFMTVIGDGINTIESLMANNERFAKQIAELPERSSIDLNYIPAKGEKVLLEPIGNHCRGTKFLNKNELIKPKMEELFDHIMSDCQGFYYGRFDLKVPHEQSLYDGKGLLIMELNGVTADPAHIFDPHIKLLKAYKDVIWHWSRIAKIARKNARLGYKTPAVSLVFNLLKHKINRKQHLPLEYA